MLAVNTTTLTKSIEDVLSSLDLTDHNIISVQLRIFKRAVSC